MNHLPYDLNASWNGRTCSAALPDGIVRDKKIAERDASPACRRRIASKAHAIISNIALLGPCDKNTPSASSSRCAARHSRELHC